MYHSIEKIKDLIKEWNINLKYKSNYLDSPL
jgi:hypothetical protein